MSNLILKKDPAIAVFAGVVVIAGVLAVGFKVATWQQATAFVVAILGMPSLFGTKPNDDSGGAQP